MSTCVECGDVELFYVLACGDPEVGESFVLLYSGRELQALSAEIHAMDAAFNAVEQASTQEDPQMVVDAQDHLAKMLDGYVTPMARLPDKHIVQTYALKGSKWTRIRSDKMRNHWRKYPIDRRLLRAQQAGGKSQLDRVNLRNAFREVTKKVTEDLKGGIRFRGQLAKAQYDWSAHDIWDTSFTRWIDAVNDSLTYSGSGAMHDLTAGAQLMRAYAGFGADLGYDPKKGTYGLSGNAEARAVLGEAEAKFSGYVPHRDGWEALIPFDNGHASVAGKQSELNFGKFRGSLVITAHAMLGASIYGTAAIEYKAQPDGRMQILPSAAGVKGEVAAGLFAGVEAGGSATGAMQWHNPGAIYTDTKKELIPTAWVNLFTIGATVAANAGAGLEGVLKITFENGKFMFRCEARAVWGIGAKGGITGGVDFKSMFEFVSYVYIQLKDNDFSYLDFMDDSAFHAVIGMLLLALEKGIDIGSIAVTGVQSLITAVKTDFADSAEAEKYARHIKSQPNELIFSPPEVKGAVLYRLSATFYSSWEEHQEAAILQVMGTMQTTREWKKVVERITPTGTKTSKAAGLARLRSVMDGGAGSSFERMLRLLSALPDRTLVAGRPVVIDNLAYA